MRVNLCVLSGSRRGECIELDADEFRAGGESSCDVYFRSENDPAARGVCVRLYREDDGWRISPVSGRESLVNQQILDSTLPIRSGDIVRLSPDGPDFRFSVVVAAVASDQPGSMTLSEGRRLGGNAAGATASRRSPRFSLSAAAMFVAAAALVLVVVAFASRRDEKGSEPFTRAEPISPMIPETTPTGKPVVTPVSSVQIPSAKPSRPSIPLSSPPSQPPVDKKTAPQAVKAQTPTPPAEVGRGPAINSSPLVVLASENKQKKVLQPFAVACAVECGKQRMLLTTARIARIMAMFPQRYYAVVPGSAEANPTIVELKRVQTYMHVLYLDNVEPKFCDAARYFDVGILLTAGKLPFGAACRVASRAKVEGIKPGAALQCWTTEAPPIVAFADEAIFDQQFRLKVRKQPVQLSQMTFLSDDDEEDHSPDDRRLFELDGPAEGFLEGSPLLNSEGELVALYSKTPVAADNEQRRKPLATAGRQQPHAALVDAEMIAALWTGKPSAMWVGYRENRSPAAAAGGGK
jgi:hypothetical protein